MTERETVPRGFPFHICRICSRDLLLESTYLFPRMGNKFEMLTKNETELKQQNNSLKLNFVLLKPSYLVMVFFVSYD